MSAATRPVRIVLADDHETVRQGLRALLDVVEGFEVVAEVGDSGSAVASVQTLTPDVLLLDLSMPGEGGLAAVRQLAKEGSKTAIVVLTRHRDPSFAHEALRAGASGYILKQSSFGEVQNAIARALRGEVYVDPLLASDGSTSADQVLKVSRREDEVLRRAALGQRNKEIAAGLQIAVKTVEVHKAQGMRKLGLQDRSALVRYATLQGWLQEL